MDRKTYEEAVIGETDQASEDYLEKLEQQAPRAAAPAEQGFDQSLIDALDAALERMRKVAEQQRRSARDFAAGR